MAREKTETTAQRNTRLALLYIGAGFAACLLFRVLFPDGDKVIGRYTLLNILMQGLESFVDVFPAVFITAILIPFGLRRKQSGDADLFNRNTERRAKKPRRGFRAAYAPIAEEIAGLPLLALSCQVIYALLCFLVLPLLQSTQGDMHYKSNLYRESLRIVRDVMENDDDWTEAARRLDVCEALWSTSKEVKELREKVGVAIPADYVKKPPADDSPFMGADDFLGTIGNNRKEKEAEEYARFRKKRKVYDDLQNGDYFSAYYTLTTLENTRADGGDDPDVARFRAESLRGIHETAFFIDEIADVGPGAEGSAIGASGDGERNRSGVRFEMDVLVSIPTEQGAPLGGRSIFRASYLAAYPDEAWGRDCEYFVVNGDNTPAAYASIPFVHITRNSVRNSVRGSGNRETTLFDTRALDRASWERRLDAKWKHYNEQGDVLEEDAQRIILDLSFDDFLLCLATATPTESLPLGELYDIATTLRDEGIAREVYFAEIVRRLFMVFLFLPLALFALSLSWSYRTQTRAVSYLLMLVVLPVICYLLVYMLGKCAALISVWAVLNFTLSGSIIFIIAITAALYLVSSLILLTRKQ